MSKFRNEAIRLAASLNRRSRHSAGELVNRFFDKLEQIWPKAMLSIPATKGFEIGSGFAATRMRALSITIHLKCAAEGFVRRPTIPVACRVAFSNGEEIISGSRLSRQRQSSRTENGN